VTSGGAPRRPGRASRPPRGSGHDAAGAPASGRPPGRTYRIARRPWEFEQIHRLNYRTFVEEIPQHPPNPERRLVDGMLSRSTAFVCLEGRRLIGMVMLSGERPFSLDRKLPDLDAYLPAASKPCEVRLLMIEPSHRRGRVFAGLLVRAARWGRRQGYDLAVISATAHQMNLYRHLGFVPFGPPLGTAAAPFQGMYVTWDRVPETVRRLVEGA
jgi:GNAT superfamily N-acetyltransferase